MENNLDVRVARLEERVIALQDSYVQTRLAHEDLKQSIDVANITLATVNQRFINIEASLAGLKESIGKLDGANTWITRLVIGTVVTSIITLALTGAAFHLR